MVKINLGLIGYNEGNGHPYSFSAIINGYNEDAMKRSRYPQISNYLDARKKSDFDIYDAEINYVWTPYDEVSNEISNMHQHYRWMTYHRRDLFHRDRLGQVPWLVDIGPFGRGGVIGEQLQRRSNCKWREQRMRCFWNLDCRGDIIRRGGHALCIGK